MMKPELRTLALWLAVGAAGLLLLACAYPRALRLLPREWSVNRAEAQAIALERLRDLGLDIERPYVVTLLRSGVELERRLQELAAELDARELRESRLAQAQLLWDVQVFRPGALPNDVAYRALLSRQGEVLSLRRQSTPATDGVGVTEARARILAGDYLREQGFDLGRLEGEPEIKRSAAAGRDELTLQYRWPEGALESRHPHGAEVYFSGQELIGFGFWYMDPQSSEIQGVLRQAQLLTFGRTFLLCFLLPVVAVAFLRLYHDGQLGVRRGGQLLLAFLLAGIVWASLSAASLASVNTLPFISRQLTTWLIGVLAVINVLLFALIAFMSWSVGELYCRRRWPQKLAALDALLRGRFDNGTVARSSLRGLASGLLLAGVAVAAAIPLQSAGAWPTGQALFGPPFSSPLPALALVSGAVAVSLASLFLPCLLVPSWASERFGSAVGLALSLLVAPFVLQPFFLSLPLSQGFWVWALIAAGPVLLFRFFDLLSALLAGVAAPLAVGAIALVQTSDMALQMNGYGVLLVMALPTLLSLRYLGSEELGYTWDDVPPHVRRIAERERQSVELETARRIQSSILPDLPSCLHGVDLAHAYLPASEVGGDFYDLLPLEDGRLALAVGDVAGHGVSSGLVMSMAKSALAVQVSFDPEVESVFETLNKTVYQSARQRLLATLCYVLLDPARGELAYATAGHLYPYRVTADGQVGPFEAGSYPLGVRPELSVPVRLQRLEPGDSLFLYSDGLVEALCPRGEEPFGFERLEESLARHAGHGPKALCEGVLADINAYSDGRPRDDDMTVLIVRLPALA